MTKDLLSICDITQDDYRHIIEIAQKIKMDIPASPSLILFLM